MSSALQCSESILVCAAVFHTVLNTRLTSVVCFKCDIDLVIDRSIIRPNLLGKGFSYFVLTVFESVRFGSVIRVVQVRIATNTD